MNLDDSRIIEIFKDYIKDSRLHYAILLDGDWGSGKTYFMKNKFIKKNKNIIYISLYGIKNKEDIDKKIYYKILENNMPQNLVKSQKIKKGFEIAEKTGAAIFSITNELIKNVFNIDVSGFKNINGSEIISLFKNISDYVIVFDDLERCEIPTNEILGYINEYVEHREVKCIIIANETEIHKTNFYNNYELKVISCLKDNLVCEEEKSVINIDNIKKRIEKIYEEDRKYKLIKEKLIGLTIKYKANMSEIYDILIKAYKKRNNKELFEFLKDNKSICIDILDLNKCNNVRTLMFALDRFEKLYNTIKTLDIDKKDLINQLVFKNVIFSSIGFKNGIDIKSLLAGCMCSSAVALKDDIKQNYNNYFTAFDFVNDYISMGNIDKDRILKTIQYYNELKYEDLDENDPFNKLKVYWELEDNELRDCLNETLKNIQNNKYSYKLFPKIICTLSYIESINFEIDIIKLIIDKMVIYVENNQIEYIDFHAFVRDEKIAEIYNNNIKLLKEKIKEKSENKNKDNITQIFELKDWGIKLKEYTKEQDYLNRKQFLSEFDISIIVDKIINSDSKNIYYFKYCIDDIYGFSNLKDFFINDIKSINELIEILDKIDKSNYGVTKKEAIEYLSKTLKEKKSILEN